MKTPRILIIAGSDSGGGAGIQADIKTVTMLGGHAMTAITAITAQNTLGVQAVMPVPAEMVLAQIDSCVSDIGVDAVKIGMIGSAATAHAVAERLERLDVPIVFDPVMIATSGSVLADADTIAAFARLMRIATVITPNLPELEVLATTLTPVRAEPVEARAANAAPATRPSTSSGRTAGEELAARFTANVLVKGGHGEGRDIEDVLINAEGSETIWTHRRIETRHTHGTGCTLASAIAAGLGDGLSLDAAADRAIKFVQHALAAAPGIGGGHGPMGHAFGRVAFYDLLAVTDRDRWDAAAFKARWA
jgi:hydroxymethylpyrimidine/phosphomethylpyrimidine kinase